MTDTRLVIHIDEINIDGLNAIIQFEANGVTYRIFYKKLIINA